MSLPCCIVAVHRELDDTASGLEDWGESPRQYVRRLAWWRVGGDMDLRAAPKAHHRHQTVPQPSNASPPTQTF
jgi:hypothetical protein